MSRSTGSINATNEDRVIANSEVEEQNKEEQPSAVSKNGESVEKGKLAKTWKILASKSGI